ncbi:MAG: MFS transporter [Candidatus Obscuribacterales bacterium]|nr:MFS transporter [Candidatus Obscuribacterales bacterium]
MNLNLPIISELDKQVVVLAAGRLASAIGTGLTVFYAPIFFVNVAGISATSVGLGIGCGGFFGILGRFLGGSLADSPRTGRRGTLIMASLLLSAGAACFAATETFFHFLIGNILTGLGIGLYWPAAESFISDITEAKKLNEAFALTRLADYTGLGLGVIAGGLVLGFHHAYRLLFVLDSLSYLILFAFILRGLEETIHKSGNRPKSILSNWLSACKDRVLLLYASLNLLFTNNILQMSSTLPLYFSNFVFPEKAGGSPVSIIFSVYIILLSLLVMPLARLCAQRSKIKVLMVACIFWAGAQLMVAQLGADPVYPLALAIATIASFAVANALYGPSASSLVVEISPRESRATYLAINSLCWGISGSLGPALGLAAMDHGSDLAVRYWIILSAINVFSFLGLLLLNKISRKQEI